MSHFYLNDDGSRRVDRTAECESFLESVLQRHISAEEVLATMQMRRTNTALLFRAFNVENMDGFLALTMQDFFEIYARCSKPQARLDSNLLIFLSDLNHRFNNKLKSIQNGTDGHRPFAWETAAVFPHFSDQLDHSFDIDGDNAHPARLLFVGTGVQVVSALVNSQRKVFYVRVVLALGINDETVADSNQYQLKRKYFSDYARDPARNLKQVSVDRHAGQDFMLAMQQEVRRRLSPQVKPNYWMLCATRVNFNPEDGLIDTFD